MLGSTGSIGRQTLEIIQSEPENFRVVALTCRNNVELIRAQIEAFRPEFVAVGDKESAQRIAAEYPGIKTGYGDEGLVQAATWNPLDMDGLLVNALVGISGLLPTEAAIKANRGIALANKETLVAGGEPIKALLREHQVFLLPLDSEHSGLWQCLKDEDPSQIRKLYITASGGSLRDHDVATLSAVTVREALSHPNWKMGDKITIDSATMMNKGFEMIEASWLFDIPIEKIEPLMHKESLVHAMVEFIDGSILMQASSHDMRLPISYALHYPSRKNSLSVRLDPMELDTLHFAPLDHQRYPLVGIAIRAFHEGGSSPAVLNAANEAAVDLFLKGKIRFTDIEKIISETLAKAPYVPTPSVETIIAIDRNIKKQIYMQMDLH